MRSAPRVSALLVLLAAAAPAAAQTCEQAETSGAAGEAARDLQSVVSDVVPPTFSRLGRLLPKRRAKATAASPACHSASTGAPASKIAFPSDIPVPEAAARQKQAFLEFSRYSCNDCEGGRGYDAWVRQVLAGELKGYNAFETRVGAMAVGEVLTWKTPRAVGTLTIVDEGLAHGFSCKTIRYELRKGNARAERPGLFCFGKANRYAAEDSWVEIY